MCVQQEEVSRAQLCVTQKRQNAPGNTKKSMQIEINNARRAFIAVVPLFSATASLRHVCMLCSILHGNESFPVASSYNESQIQRRKGPGYHHQAECDMHIRRTTRVLSPHGCGAVTVSEILYGTPSNNPISKQSKEAIRMQTWMTLWNGQLASKHTACGNIGHLSFVIRHSLRHRPTNPARLRLYLPIPRSIPQRLEHGLINLRAKVRQSTRAINGGPTRTRLPVAETALHCKIYTPRAKPLSMHSVKTLNLSYA